METEALWEIQWRNPKARRPLWLTEGEECPKAEAIRLVKEFQKTNPELEWRLRCDVTVRAEPEYIIVRVRPDHDMAAMRREAAE